MSSALLISFSIFIGHDDQGTYWNSSSRKSSNNDPVSFNLFNFSSYPYKKNDRIIAFFNGFDDSLSEEAMWQISEKIKPRGGKKT